MFYISLHVHSCGWTIKGSHVSQRYKMYTCRRLYLYTFIIIQLLPLIGRKLKTSIYNVHYGSFSIAVVYIFLNYAIYCIT